MYPKLNKDAQASYRLMIQEIRSNERLKRENVMMPNGYYAREISIQLF